jgi:WD40 repeat protein
MIEFSHDDRVSSVAFSPDGARIATGGFDGKARVWSLQSGGLEHDIVHSDPLWSVDFRSTEVLVTAGSGVPSVRLWRLDERPPAQTHVIEHRDLVTGILIDGARQRMATIGIDPVARLWDLPTAREVLDVSHEAVVSSVDISPDGEQLLTASRDKTARLWSVVTGTEIHRLAHPGVVAAAAFNPRGYELAATGCGDTLRTWETRTGRELSHLTIGATINTLAFSPDGSRLALGASDGSVSVFRILS